MPNRQFKPSKPAPAKRTTSSTKLASRPTQAAAAVQPTKPAAPETKQAQLIAKLRHADGATLTELTTCLGWQAHSIRGAISAVLRKRLGFEVTSSLVEGRGRVYHLSTLA